MKRKHNCNEGIITEYKNGNITIKFYPENVSNDQILELSELLFWNDCYIIGDQFCLSNYDAGCLIYNTYSDLCYILSFSQLENAYKTGKTMRLYARVPDEYDRETIENYFD